MMKNRRLLKITSVLLSIVLLCSGLLLNVSAEENVSFFVSSKAYFSEQDLYAEKDTFNVGETVYISVSVSRIYALGGMAFDVIYDSDVFEFKKNSAICLIDDKDASVTYSDNTASKISIAYFTAAYNKVTSVTGEIFILPFVIKGISNNLSSSFSLVINSLYDNTPWQNDIGFNGNDSCTVEVVAADLPKEVIDAAAALENIEYPDSKADIDSALQMYNNLSNEQKSALKEKYPSHYEWLNTATERYNKKAEQANKDAILTEVEDFKKIHSVALECTVDNVKINHQTAVEAAIKALENCSAAAKSYLMKESKLLDSLSNRIEELLEIKAEINDFLTSNSYSIVWNEEKIEKDCEYNYSIYGKYFDLAIASYAMLSSEAQAQLTEEYEYLLKIKAKIDEYFERDEKAAALAEKVSAFIQTYMHAFTRNQNNVSIEDKAAINMVLQAYDRLEDQELKDALSKEISELKLLLEVLDELGAETEKETVFVEVPGETVTERVEVPGETVTERIEVPGETVVEKVEGETVTETRIDKIVQFIRQKSSLSNMILYLFVLLGVSILILMAAYVLSEKHKKDIDKYFYNNESGGLME